MLSIEDETCIECGLCADVLPQYFEVAEGRVRVRRGRASSEAEGNPEALAAASRDCPSGSIRS